MNPNIVKRNELLAQKVIKGLESRNMSGYYAASKEEALKLALTMIPEGSSVTMGGAMSAHEIGLVDALKAGNYNFIDRDAYEDKLDEDETAMKSSTLMKKLFIGDDEGTISDNYVKDSITEIYLKIRNSGVKNEDENKENS